jgi:tRNA G46 methylase TrmB
MSFLIEARGHVRIKSSGSAKDMAGGSSIPKSSLANGLGKRIQLNAAVFGFFKNHPQMSKGIEMGCEKGRNLIWLAEQEKQLQLLGFDFSFSAIHTVEQRSRARGYEDRIQFEVKDATQA